MATGVIKGRVVIEGVIECLSGLRVGVGQETMEIGGLDMPVIRDPLSGEPYIPGSSLKGKLRSLLERVRLAELVSTGSMTSDGENYKFYNKNLAASGRPDVRHHECEEDKCVPCRVFGTSQGAGVTKNRPGRLVVRDCRLLNPEQLREAGTGFYTEIKQENALDRVTAAASPRQVERVPRGAKFGLKLVYTVDNDEEALTDLDEIISALRLLEDDYLGGCGSRGYGEIQVKEIIAKRRPLGWYLNPEKEKEVVIDLALASTTENQKLKELLGVNCSESSPHVV